MENTMTPLSPEDTFQFSCGNRLPCFNHCCRDLNQFLTPYDILRLKNGLGISSTEFLAGYTNQHTGPESGLPIITLKPEMSSDRICPFVSPAGCRVYRDRPSSCRMYPLVRTLSRSRKTRSVSETFILLKEPHCKGFDHNHSQTIGEWIASQGLEMYNQMNDMLMEIISLKNAHLPGPLDRESRQMFHMALYDLDRFRDNIINKGLLDNPLLEPRRLDAIKNDDVALLKFGHRLIKNVLDSVKRDLGNRPSHIVH
jgi:Fe-S-cluster containining protein